MPVLLEGPIRIFLCGDVMTGRGIDQILPHPGDPTLQEAHMKSARGYVRLAEETTGPIPYPVDFSYIWGDTLVELKRMKPDLKIINLETSVTQSKDYWKGKGIHYRMNPENVPCLTTAGIDCCSLANNHVLDWGYPGLLETLETLEREGIKTAGAGRDMEAAEAPAVLEVPGRGRVVVFGFGSPTSGVLPSWAAGEHWPGVNVVKDFSDVTLAQIAKRVNGVKQAGDVVVASIHWCGNWGFGVPDEHRRFAHGLIDDAQVDIIHGHSSHHVKGIEVYKDKLILYGCGDFLNDYEGIGGYEAYRPDLSAMYFATVDPSAGKLECLEMASTRLRHFRVERASIDGGEQLREMLDRESRKFGARVEPQPDGTLVLRWS
ncbi:MAG: CapA family protein [Chloroflexi bacterium]|nr:CapA family protein [Chloroflexota bacterium]